jgi:hypothetical protein
MNQVRWIPAHTRVETTGDLQRQEAKSVLSAWHSGPSSALGLLPCMTYRPITQILKCSYTLSYRGRPHY